MVFIYAIIGLTILLLVISANLILHRYCNWEKDQDVTFKQNADQEYENSDDDEEDVPPLVNIQIRHKTLPPTMLWQIIPPRPDKSNVIRPRGLRKTVRKTSL